MINENDRKIIKIMYNSEVRRWYYDSYLHKDRVVHHVERLSLAERT